MPTPEVETFAKPIPAPLEIPVGSPGGASSVTSPGSASSFGAGRRRSSGRPVQVINKDLLDAKSGHLPPKLTKGEKRKKEQMRRKMTNRMKYCTTIVRELTSGKNQQIAWPFMSPVNPVELGIVDYFTVLEAKGIAPMDLGTLKANLDIRHYDTPEEFHHAIGNLFKACFAYNPEGNAIHDLGAQLLAEYKEMMEHEPEVYNPSPDSGFWLNRPFLASHTPRRFRAGQLTTPAELTTCVCLPVLHMFGSVY